LIRQNKLAGWARVVTTPLKKVQIASENYKWYSERPGTNQKIDLLIVDGPPGSTGPKARFPAIPILRPHLSANAVIMLDDINRADEQDILSEWLAHLPSSRVETYGSTSKSCFAVIHTGPPHPPGSRR
jgi:hypothetical protein